MAAQRVVSAQPWKATRLLLAKFAQGEYFPLGGLHKVGSHPLPADPTTQPARDGACRWSTASLHYARCCGLRASS